MNWIVEPEPILRTGGQDSWEPTGLYCSGAVVTPDQKVAVMYAAQKFPLWMGFGLALAEHPLGPFTKHAGNPVYKHYTHAHEFDLVRTDEPGRRYLMFYSGFTDTPRRGPAGDRGYVVYSNDLIQWTPHASNPTFGPETLGNWDAIHVRPRSLTKIGDTWYLWYEVRITGLPPRTCRTPFGPGGGIPSAWLARKTSFRGSIPAQPGAARQRHQQEPVRLNLDGLAPHGDQERLGVQSSTPEGTISACARFPCPS